MNLSKTLSKKLMDIIMPTVEEADDDTFVDPDPRYVDEVIRQELNSHAFTGFSDPPEAFTTRAPGERRTPPQVCTSSEEVLRLFSSARAAEQRKD